MLQEQLNHGAERRHVLVVVAQRRRRGQGILQHLPYRLQLSKFVHTRPSAWHGTEPAQIWRTQPSHLTKLRRHLRGDPQLAPLFCGECTSGRRRRRRDPAHGASWRRQRSRCSSLRKWCVSGCLLCCVGMQRFRCCQSSVMCRCCDALALARVVMEQKQDPAPAELWPDHGGRNCLIEQNQTQSSGPAQQG